MISVFLINSFASFYYYFSKYYDDCAQILSEHILALIKPAALKSFSTLDPLVTTSLNRETAASLAEAARMIPARLEPDQQVDSIDEQEAVTNITSTSSNTPNIGNTGSASVVRTTTAAATNDSTGELLKSAAATLMEGAVPVREFPANLTSEPASITQSGNSSVTGNSEHRETPTRKGTVTSSFPDNTHEEELRCVLAIVRHGDRTPKQKLKVNMREPHILRYFHEQ